MKMININTKKIKKRDTIYNISKIIKYCSINILYLEHLWQRPFTIIRNILRSTALFLDSTVIVSVVRQR